MDSFRQVTLKQDPMGYSVIQLLLFFYFVSFFLTKDTLFLVILAVIFKMNSQFVGTKLLLGV